MLLNWLRRQLDKLPPRKESGVLVDIPTIFITWTGGRVHQISTVDELKRFWLKTELFIQHGYEDFKSVPQRIRIFIQRIAKTWVV